MTVEPAGALTVTSAGVLALPDRFEVISGPLVAASTAGVIGLGVSGCGCGFGVSAGSFDLRLTPTVGKSEVRAPIRDFPFKPLFFNELSTKAVAKRPKRL